LPVEQESSVNADLTHDKEPLRNPTPSGTNLDSRLAAEELALAARIQLELMSIRLPSVSYARLTGKTIPCRAIGGDFFDAIALTDATCAVVADVSGKGIPAAIVAAMLQGIIHAEIQAYQPLTTIATTVNDFLCSRTTGTFATMVLLKIWENGRLEYLNCGHVPPRLVTDASVHQLEGGNAVVGLIPSAQYTSETCRLMPGNRVMIFTDGITEAENSEGEQFGDAAIECGLSSVDAVLEQLTNFQGSLELSDDCTLFELLYEGVESLTASSCQFENRV
jgi:serine phosphatase RsbU (regulator of sigma subunit)